jgi:hypothetical protein
LVGGRENKLVVRRKEKRRRERVYAGYKWWAFGKAWHSLSMEVTAVILANWTKSSITRALTAS